MFQRLLLTPAVLLLLRIVAAVFVAEALVMFLLTRLQPSLWDWRESLLDAALLSLLLTPLFWRWLVFGERQRRRADEHIRLQSAALTAAANAILIANREGTITWINPAFSTLTGYTLEEAVGMNPRDLVKSGRQEQAVYADLWQTILAGGVWHGELVNRRKDGSLYPEEQTITPVRDAQGGITHFIAVKQDLTARKRADETLRQAEAKFRSIFDHAIEGIYQTTPEGKFLAANLAMARILGYDSAAELLAFRTDIALQGYVDPARREEFMRRVTQDGVVRGFEYEVRCKDGSRKWVYENARVVRDAPGTILYFEGSMQDITARKRTEDALRQSEASYRRLVDTMREGLGVQDRDGRITFVNQRGCEMLGYALEELIGLPVTVLYDEENQRILREQMVLRRAGVRQSYEIAWRHKNGGNIDTIISPCPLLDDKGDFAGSVAVFTDITERKRVETELRQSESRFRAVTQSAHEAIITADSSGVIVEWNRGAEVAFGYRAAEAVGQSLELIIPPQFRAQHREGLKRLQAGGEPRIIGKNVEMTGLRKDGSEFPLELSLAQWTIPSGGFFTSIIRDITARKQAEESLRLFRSLVDQSNDTFEVIDLESGRFLDVNEKGPAELGYSRAEYLSFRVCDIDPTIAESAWPRIAEEIRTAGALSGEGCHRRKDGTTFPIEFNVKWVRHDRNYCVAVVRDITERKLAEAVLRRSEERYRLLFEDNPLPIWVYDTETLRFLAVNESAIRHYGYTREEFMSLTVEQIRPPEDMLAFRQSIAMAGAGERRSEERRHRRKDGTVFHVETLSRPLAFEGRSARLVLANDITEKRLLQEKFLHAQRLESLGTLASGIAHDLNNMLAPIIFAGPLLRQSCTSPGELELINILERSSERGASLVRQILAFAHGTTGEPQLTQVKHLARDIGSLIEKTFPKAIQFEAGIPSDLWPAVVNPTQIHQVLLNLCVNARDAMPQGGTLSLRAANRRLDSSEADAIPGARPGSWLVLEVADTGTGIRPEDLPHIWEPFFTTKTPEKGTGLGLATVFGIVSAHQGFIQLETAVGCGATFRIFLPANPVQLPRPVVPALSAVARGNGEFILVIDDDEAIRDIVAAILSQHGYQVVTCADGIEALTRFNAQPNGFPVVITDVDMPLLSGTVLAGVVRQLQPDVRVLAMSGLSGGGTDGSDVRTIKELAHAFLAKPFLPEDLLVAVHRLLHPPPAP